MNYGGIKNFTGRYQKEIVLFLISFIIHLLMSIFLYNKFGDQVLFFENEDAHSYINLAQSIASGTGFSREGVVSAVRTPLFPLLVSSIFIFHLPVTWSVLILQNLFFSFTVVLLYRLGKDWFSARVGFIAGGIYLVEPYLAMTANLATTETLFNFLLVGFLYFFSRFYLTTTANYRALGWSAFFAGLATLTRPVAQFLPLAVIALFAIQYIFKRQAWSSVWRGIIVFTAIFFIVLAPWIGRQYYHYHRFRITTSDAYMLYFKIAPLVIADQKNITYNTATELLRQRLVDRFPDFTEEGIYNSFRYYDVMVNEAKEIIKERPLPVIRFYLLSFVPSLFGTGYEYMLENVAGIVREIPRVSYTSLISSTEWSMYYEAIRQINIFQIALFCGALVWFMIYALIMLTLAHRNVWHKHGWAMILSTVLIGYFVFFSLGPASHARYRVPTFPLWFMLVAFAIDFFLKKRKLEVVASPSNGQV